MPALQLFVPLMIAPVPVLVKVWLAPKVNGVVRPETLKMAPLVMPIIGVPAMEPPPFNASVPALTVVLPV